MADEPWMDVPTALTIAIAALQLYQGERPTELTRDALDGGADEAEHVLRELREQIESQS